MAFCSNCGCEVTGRFCSSCGAPLQSMKKGTEDNTQNTIKDVIVLRACISASVSQYLAAKKAEEEYEREIENLNKEIRKTQSLIEELEHSLLRKEEEIQQQITSKSTELSNLRKLVDQYENTTKAINAITFISILLTLFFVPISIVTFINERFVIGCFSALFQFAIWIFNFALLTDKEIKTAKKINREYRIAQRMVPTKIGDIRARWEEDQVHLRQELDQKTKQLKEKINELQEQIQQIRGKIKLKIAPLCDISIALLELIENEFSTHLSVRDWHHLDSIIFYMLTGRAETIKEALVLIDAQQPDVAKMNLEIQEDLRGFAQENTAQIARVADHLDYRLSRCYDETTETGKARIAEIAPFITPEAIKKALLERVRISSVILMERVAWMRERAK